MEMKRQLELGVQEEINFDFSEYASYASLLNFSYVFKPGYILTNIEAP
jgi:hypothetical protein